MATDGKSRKNSGEKPTDAMKAAIHAPDAKHGAKTTGGIAQIHAAIRNADIHVAVASVGAWLSAHFANEGIGMKQHSEWQRQINYVAQLPEQDRTECIGYLQTLRFVTRLDDRRLFAGFRRTPTYRVQWNGADFDIVRAN